MTYQSAEIVPDFGDVRIQANCSGVCIKRIPVLVNLIVKNTNGAPERWVAPVSVDCLLICFVCFRVLLLGHVTPSEKVPALRVGIV